MNDHVPTLEDTVEFPAAPWRLAGHHWGALFRTDRSVDTTKAMALGAKPFFSKRLGVAVLRYTTGTLCYDELIVSIPIRIGLVPYLWIRDIWVSDRQPQAGGIHIWNLPKQLASFTWSEHAVSITDSNGLIASLRLKPTRTHWPWSPALLPIAGSENGGWKTATAKWSGRVSFTQPVVEEWSERFPERLLPGRAFGFSSSRFQMTIPAPKHRS